MGSRGYVVRGKDRQGRDCWASGDVAGFARASRRESATAYADLDSAIEGWAFMHGTCHDVTILAVAEDGTETALPSYEKALGELVRLREVLGCKAEEETHVVAERLLTEIERCVDALKGAIGPTPADPLAALEAAERRLLEAGGWREVEAGRWKNSDGFRAATVNALDIERRRLAAKGGA